VPATLATPVKRRARLCFEIFTLTALAAYVSHVLLGLGGTAVDGFFQDVVYNGLIAAAAAACLFRALWSRAGRAAWAAIGLGILAFLGGELYYTLALQHMAAPPYPSLGDASYLLFYPLSYAGLLLALPGGSRARSGIWLDGLIASLACLAVMVALLLDPIVAGTEGSQLAVATTIAYPLGDFVLLAFILGVLAVSGGHAGREWGLLATGMALVAVADVVFLNQSAVGTYEEGGLLDALWPGSMLVLGYAALHPSVARGAPAQDRSHLLLGMPALSALVALGLLVYGNAAGMNTLALVLASLTLVATITRMALTFRDNVQMVAHRTEQALTDSLTGLGNRRSLMHDLERTLESTMLEPCMLLLFDLDGFKRYNDSYGHPAGDALLVGLGQKLAAAVRPYGTAYRLGGDEFCTLVTTGPPGPDAIASRLAESLQEDGGGWHIGASFGSVLLPLEASEAAAALQIADQRMYDSKGSSRRSSVTEQTRDVLLEVERVREPDLRDHSCDVARLSRCVGERLGVVGVELDELAQAAELHDIGKMAVPEAILRKPGHLDAAEWAFMRQHTVIGERMLNAAPSLAPLAPLVRASHERWDGRGYPDGLAGEAIPLAARIIAVCDAFHAMISDRPYRAPLAAEAALDELRRSAGSQFDPAVVDAVAQELASRELFEERPRRELEELPDAMFAPFLPDRVADLLP